MARILLLIFLAWLLYVVIKRIIATAHFKNSASNQAEPSKPEEKIVQCAKCGLHVPESESLISNNQVICNNPDCRSK